MRKTQTALSEPTEPMFDPVEFVKQIEGTPSYFFEWGDPKEKKGRILPKSVRGKRRLIGHPNKAMRQLHHAFGRYLTDRVEAMGYHGMMLRKLPSATGCIPSSNPTANAAVHAEGRYSYVTDLASAYPSVDLDKLSLLLLYILRHKRYGPDYSLDMFARNELAHLALRTDPLYAKLYAFVAFAFGGLYGVGLAVGGNLSPLLLNLYCEVFLDSRLRAYLVKAEDKRFPERTVTYTRFVDDLVFSRGIPIPFWARAEIRKTIEDAGFKVNHRKSKVLDRTMGTVFVTKVGMRVTAECAADAKAILVFPQKKRRRLHGIIGSYLATPFQRDDPEVIRGLIAEFIYYIRCALVPTETDKKTLALCKKFERGSDTYRKHYKKERPKR